MVLLSIVRMEPTNIIVVPQVMVAVPFTAYGVIVSMMMPVSTWYVMRFVECPRGVSRGAVHHDPPGQAPVQLRCTLPLGVKLQLGRLR